MIAAMVPACSLTGCEQRRYCRGLCTTHYSRVQRTGSAGPAERLRGVYGEGHVNGKGYHQTHDRDHPLATAQGVLTTHRAVLFEKLGPGMHPCHWCGVVLPWRGGAHVGINADHVDGDKLNNDPENLVPACLNCNTHRPAVSL